MDSIDIKQKVLQQLIQAMDDRHVNDLKSKSPKFGMAKVDIQSDDPKLADELKNKLMGGQEGSPEEEQAESPEEMLKEKMHPDLEAKELNSEEEQDLKRLLSMYESLK